MVVHTGWHISLYKCKACYLIIKGIRWDYKNVLEWNISSGSLFPSIFLPIPAECFHSGYCHPTLTPFIRAESAGSTMCIAISSYSWLI